jgi:leucyl-tRNA synthetase
VEHQGRGGRVSFLGRVWRLFVDEKSETEFEQAQTAQGADNPDSLAAIKLSAAIQDAPATAAQLKTLHACIKKVTEDLDGFRFNTAISALMIFVNDAITWETKPAAVMRDFLILLQPVRAPPGRGTARQTGRRFDAGLRALAQV